MADSKFLGFSIPRSKKNMREKCVKCILHHAGEEFYTLCSFFEHFHKKILRFCSIDKGKQSQYDKSCVDPKCNKNVTFLNLLVRFG